MLHTHIKQGLRLNRSMGFALLMYDALLLGSLQTPSAQHTPWPLARVGAMFGLSMLFLLFNEIGLRSIKRHPRLDELALEKIGLVMTMMGAGFLSLCYLLSGHLGIFLFLGLTIVQAQLHGHRRTSQLLVALSFLLYAITVPLGYPMLMGFAHISAPFSIQALLVLTPFMLVLMHFGAIVGTLIRSTSNKVSKLQSLAATDGLTGLINRRQFNHQLDAENARAKRYRKPLSLALFDIDDFKKINDFYGHPTGDRILKELGALITQNVRESDISARYGGEEFALILPETGQIDAYELLERLRAIVEHTVFCLPDNPMTITISVGVAQLNPDQPKSYELIERADAALYEAKKQGKNQVIYGVLSAPKVSYPPFTPS